MNLDKNPAAAMAPLLLDSVGTLNVYFRGKKVGTGQPGALVAFRQDRLGSSVKTYPYGEEKVANGVDGWKFATWIMPISGSMRVGRDGL